MVGGRQTQLQWYNFASIDSDVEKDKKKHCFKTDFSFEPQAFLCCVSIFALRTWHRGKYLNDAYLPSS